MDEETTVKKLNQIILNASKAPLYAALYNRKVSSLEEFSTKIPFTLKKDLKKAYPYGGLAVPKEKIIEMHTSSGTSGLQVGSFLTKNDIEEGSQEIAKAWSAFGVNEKSIVMFAMKYGLYSGAAINTYAIQSLGAFVIPASIIPIEKYIDFILDYGVTHIVAVPGFYFYLYNKMIDKGINPKSTSITTLIAAGEVYSEQTRKEIEDRFNAVVYDHYGLVEINTGICFECFCKDGLHVLDEYVYAEVIDFTNSKKPVSANIGQKGELVLTTLNKEASPVIRYRTGDIVTNLGVVRCKCNRLTQKISRIHGRADSVVSIKGVKIDPYLLRSSIKKNFSLVNENMFTLRVRKNCVNYTPTIFVTLKNPNTINSLKNFLYQTTSVNFDVQHIPIDYWFKNKNKVSLIEYI